MQLVEELELLVQQFVSGMTHERVVQLLVQTEELGKSAIPD